MSGNKEKLVVLQARDRRLLSELSVMRVIDRELAKKVAGFDSTTRANARLLALTEAGYLKRSFVGTVAGGRKAVYGLSIKAAQVVGAENPGVSWKAHSELFLEHQLQVNDIYVRVKHEPIPHPGWGLGRWISFSRVLSKTCSLIPDGYFELHQEAAVRSLFLEVDLGTEARRIWQKKIDGYLKLALTGEFQRLFGQSQFRVLVVAPSERRIENLRKLAAKSTDKIFRFTTFELIKRKGFWSAIWQKQVGDQREPLL